MSVDIQLEAIPETDTMPALTVGHLAKLAGISPSLVREYANRNLIETAVREKGKRRKFHLSALKDIALVRKLSEKGLGLSIIAALKESGYTLEQISVFTNEKQF